MKIENLKTERNFVLITPVTRAHKKEKFNRFDDEKKLCVKIILIVGNNQNQMLFNQLNARQFFVVRNNL